jgi:AraC-like DNA-binding protein
VINVSEMTDLDEIHDMLQSTYSRMQIATTGDRHRLRFARVDVGPIALHRLSFRMRFTADIEPTGLIPVGRHLIGSVSNRIGSDVVETRPGDLFLGGQPGRRQHAEVEDYDGEHARFPPELFAQVADAVPGRTAAPIRFTGYRPVSAQAAATWSKTFDYIRDTVAGLDIEQEPLVVGTAVRMLAAVTLATFPNTAVCDPTIEDRHDAHPATLRRALAFIEANADRDITPVDVAVAARVTVRSVQLAFRRHLDTTPTAYLRHVRLRRAHDELLAGDPAVTTVSAVAMRWGFASHSSFAASYRVTYGIPPSATLNQR